MSAAFPIFISEITLKSVSICIVLTLVGFLGILLIAMLNDDVFKPRNPDEKLRLMWSHCPFLPCNAPFCPAEIKI